MAAYEEGKVQLHTHTFLTLALDRDALPALYPGTHQVGGCAVMQLVEALHYKPEGRGFNSQFGHWNFSLT